MGTQGGGGISNPQGGILDFFCVFGCLAKFVFFCVHLCVFVFPPPPAISPFLQGFFFTQKILHFYSAPIFPQAKTVSHFLFLSYFLKYVSKIELTFILKIEFLFQKKQKEFVFWMFYIFFAVLIMPFLFWRKKKSVQNMPLCITMFLKTFQQLCQKSSKNLVRWSFIQSINPFQQQGHLMYLAIIARCFICK